MKKQIGSLSNEELGRLFPIILENWNPDWPNIYLEEKRKILKNISDNYIIDIQHIGSTAIPGIISKPTIDILLIISENADIKNIINDLKFLNYFYIEKKDKPPPHMMFAKGYTIEGFKGQAYHIHVRYEGDWDEIYFRDHLQKNKNIAEEYSKLKIVLSQKYRHNREEYTEGKTEFVKKISRIARDNINNT